MTTIQFILIAIAAFIVLAVLFMVMRRPQHRQNLEPTTIAHDKNGIPIIPRHERNLVDESDFDDDATLNSLIENETPESAQNHSEAPISTNQNRPSMNDGEEDADYARWQAEQIRADDSELKHLATQMPHNALDDDQEPDVFSNLLSATDHIMPIVDTAEEPSFTDNSPILDKHLSEPVNQAQNAPLLNAQDNINITILPYQYRDRPPTLIRGRDLLNLVDKYGLRFGAMNMFHRYEEKDGTGMLWFSMMGVTDDGIAPFDPHNVATNTYSGLVVFLSLPHPQALLSFDSMMSVAYLMANDLDAMILDENNETITPEYKQQLRNQVGDYDA